MSYLTHLECSYCQRQHDANQLIRVCNECGYPLLARYDLEQAAAGLDRDELADRPAGLWRYHDLLPVRDRKHVITLGEGGTPILGLNLLGRKLELEHLFLKDEGQNPTGTFKALGLSEEEQIEIYQGTVELVKSRMEKAQSV